MKFGHHIILILTTVTNIDKTMHPDRENVFQEENMNIAEIISNGDIKELKSIAEFIVECLPCRVTAEPSAGMVMVKVVDPLEKTPFYLGEAYATQCEVEIEGKIGYGCVLGNDEERALYGAILDAVMSGGHDISGRVKLRLIKIQEEIMLRRDAEIKGALRTRVNFDVKKG